MTKGRQKGSPCGKGVTAENNFCPLHQKMLEKIPRNPCTEFECVVDPLSLRAQDGFLFDRNELPEETLRLLKSIM